MNPSHFAYKNYLSNLLSFSSDGRTCLTSTGFYLDNPIGCPKAKDNRGFTIRNQWFRQEHLATNEYKTDATTFIGKLSKTF